MVILPVIRLDAPDPCDLTHYTEIYSSLIRAEAVVLADALRAKNAQPRHAPSPGRWRLLDVKAHRSEFPDGMTWREAVEAGKARQEGNRAFRLHRIVARWVLVDNSVPRGAAAINAARVACKHGHPLSGGNLQATAGRRRCKVCARQASAGSRLKAKQKRTASLGKSLRRSAPRPPIDVRLS